MTSLPPYDIMKSAKMKGDVRHVEISGPVFLCLLILATAAAFDLHARWVFIACAYVRVHHHGKTFKRASRHYKTNWSFAKKLFWIPVFAEHYAPKYRAMAILSFIHYTVTAVTLALFIMADGFGIIPDPAWIICFCAVFAPFSVGRFIYTNAVARDKP